MTWSWEELRSHLGRAWLYIVSILILAFLVIPVLIVVPMSFSASQFLEFPPSRLSLRWYRAFFESAEWLDSAWVSLRVAALTTLLTLPLGTAAAYGLHVAQSRKWVGAIHAAVATPIIIPGILISIGAFYLYARVGLVNSITGLVLAHTVLALPFAIILVGASLKQFDLNQEKVARSLGASRPRAFLDVVMPQISRALISGGLLTFITSLDEVVVSMMISSGTSSTMTRRMFTSLRDEIDPTIAAISTMLVAVTLFAVSFSGVRWSAVLEKKDR